jgi:hypothetical protein
MDESRIVVDSPLRHALSFPVGNYDGQIKRLELARFPPEELSSACRSAG